MRTCRAIPYSCRCFAVAMALSMPAIIAADEGTVFFRRTLPSDSGLTDGRYRELKYGQDEWYGSTFFTGPDWTRVGKDWHHPGQETPSVRCFVVPHDGCVTVSGRVAKLHLSGDGIRAAVLHNEREIWKTEIDGDDSEGVAHELPLDVRQGDRIRFVVDKRGTISCDTTGWDPSVQFENNTTTRASEAFEQHKQGAGDWRYEMEVRPGQETGLPMVYGWTAEKTLQPWTVRPSKPVELTNGDALPLLVVANGKDQGGLALIASPQSEWRFVAAMDDNGHLQIAWHAEQGTDTSVAVWAEPYQGNSTKGWIECDRCLKQDARFAAVAPVGTSHARNEAVPLALRAMVQSDWRRQDAIDGSARSFSVAARAQLEKTRQLLSSLPSGPDFLPDGSQHLAQLADDVRAAGSNLHASRSAWLRVRQLKRRVALSNPLLDFGPMLACKRVPPSWSHLVAQYFGWRQRPGGGLHVIERPGYSLETRDILGDQLPAGSVLEPRLSYDGGRILFAFVACSDDVPEPASLPVNESGPPQRYFHLYEINVDGSGLRQLTDGPYDDMMAEYLPHGDVVFCSTRRKGYSRCFGPEYSYRWHTYTLHRMSADGGNIRTLSYNDVSEWFPAVSNSGHVLHARWDYIDRDAVTHQNLWSIRPDGTNPVAVWGNASPKPHCTFQAKPIPDSNKIVFIASAHHSITAGPVCLLDPAVDANSLRAVTRVTPQPFPEAEGTPDDWYAAPWPLSEDYFLVAYSADRLRLQGEHRTNPNPDNALGIYLLDTAGNRELLYRDPDIGTTNPTPLAARRRPPIVPSADRLSSQNTGTMVVADVYQGLSILTDDKHPGGNVPRGAIKQIRIVQVFPKTTWLVNQPRMGIAGEENGRAILGTVPVEPDGSAYFEVPAGKPILFQALDEQGMAYQTMRSLTFVQPGEQTSCVGCHEHRMSSPRSDSGGLLALRRPPSVIEPGELGGRPFGFVETVQPVLERQCVHCHGSERIEAGLDLSNIPDGDFTRPYVALCKPSPKGSPSDGRPLVPRFAQRNQIQATPPGGAHGARGSRLMRLLLDGHEGVVLSDGEIRRLAAWIDMNAIFYGVYDAESRSRQVVGGSVAMPEIQ